MAFWVEESIVGCRVVSVHSLRIFFCYYSKKNWLLTLVLSSLHVTLWGDFAFCIALCGLSRSDHMVHWWDIWKSREQVSSDRISTVWHLTLILSWQVKRYEQERVANDSTYWYPTLLSPYCIFYLLILVYGRITLRQCEVCLLQVLWFSFSIGWP